MSEKYFDKNCPRITIITSSNERLVSCVRYPDGEKEAPSGFTTWKRKCDIVEPPVATNSRKRPSLLSDLFSKIPKVFSQVTIFETSCKRAPFVSYRDHFYSLKFEFFFCFLTSCKRPVIGSFLVGILPWKRS